MSAVGAFPVQTRGVLVLVFVTMIWGTTFPLIAIVQTQLEPAVLVAARFTLAALVVLPWLPRFSDRAAWRAGAALGVLLFTAFVFQTVGLKMVSPGRAAFITGLNVIMVPLLMPFLRRHVPWTAFLGALLAVAGIVVMSWDAGALKFGQGDFLMLGCALIYAIYVLLLEHHAPKNPPLGLTAVQVSTVAVLGLLWGLPSLTEGVPRFSPGLWAMVIYMGVVAITLTTWLQAVVQRSLPAFQTAVIYSLEPVFAALFAWWWLGERLTRQSWLGAALILLAMVVSQVQTRHGPSNNQKENQRG